MCSLPSRGLWAEAENKPSTPQTTTPKYRAVVWARHVAENPQLRGGLREGFVGTLGLGINLLTIFCCWHWDLMWAKARGWGGGWACRRCLQGTVGKPVGLGVCWRSGWCEVGWAPISIWETTNARPSYLHCAGPWPSEWGVQDSDMCGRIGWHVICLSHPFNDFFISDV